jgi:hypothetical protein
VKKTKRAVLPDTAQGRLLRLGEDIRSGRDLAPGLEAVLVEFDSLAPKLAIAGDREVARLCGLHSVGWEQFPSGLVAPAPWDRRLLARSPGLEWICIFHADGRTREQALDRISVPPRNAFLFAALAYRLNDWAWQVRAAAERCARRVFPLTMPDVVADTAIILLERKRLWQRWRGGASALDDALQRQDVAGPLADRIVSRQSGAVASVLREALRGLAMDTYLPMIAREAAQPGVRATALSCLIERRATWLEGYAQEWVDKSLGVSRRAPVLGGRALTTAPPREALVARAAADAAAAVRKIAADSLIKYRNELTNLDAVMAALADDPNPGVRERLDYLMRVRQSTDPAR